MNLDDEVRLSGKSHEVLNNDAFKYAFGEIELSLLEGIKRCALKDADLREKLCLSYTLLHQLRDQLQSIIDTGRMAEKSLMDKMRDRFNV
jgi:hypothetical protein